MGWTGLSYLDVRLQSGSDTGSLYRNSRHQVGVVVSIVPFDNGQPVEITPEELAGSITLLDYVSGKKLESISGWKVGTKANAFHSLGADDEPVPAVANENGLYQIVRYVTCEEGATIRTVRVGVKVKPTDGSAIESKQFGDWHSSVQLTTLEPITYSLSDNGVTVYTRDIYRSDGFQQTNYFLCINGRADGMDHHAFRLGLGGREDPFFVYSMSGTTKVAQAWPLGAQNSTRTKPPVSYNQRPHEACITLLKFVPSGVPPNNSAVPQPITIYDQYGNTGNFHCQPTGSSGNPDYGDAIQIVDGLPPSPDGSPPSP